MKNYFQVQSDLFDYGLTPYDIAVYNYLAMRRNRRTGTAWPAVSSIAKDCNMGESTVRRSIKLLKEKGLVIVTPHYQPTHKGWNRQTANIYEIPALDSQSAPTPATQDNGPYLEGGEEIYTTKINRTKSIEPYSTEQDFADEEYDELKGILFHKDELYRYNSADIAELARRSLDSLWQKKKMAVDGINYTQDEIRRLIIEELDPWVMSDAIEAYLSADTVKKPSAYLSTCILSSAINYGSKIARQAEKDHREGKW